jgi:hypothetical protein
MRILRGLTSRLLKCGCVAGIYETYDGEIVTLIDERQSTCSDSTHENGNRIPGLAVASQAPDLPFQPDRRS